MVYTGLIGVCCLQYIYYIYIEHYLQENNVYDVDNYGNIIYDQYKQEDKDLNKSDSYNE